MKEAKFKIDQKVYVTYINRIETRKVTGIIKENHNLEYSYYLDYDTSYFYYEKKLYNTKEQARKYLLDKAREDYINKLKIIF